MASLADVRKHVEGCERSARQPWVTPELCEIRKSAKHGLGVFALKNIPAFTLITLYPADGIRTWKGQASYDGAPDAAPSILLEKFEGMTPAVMKTYSACVPQIDSCFVEIIGDPTNVKDSRYLGHMCNDYCKMTTPEQAILYEMMSDHARNASLGLVPEEAQDNEELFEALGVWSVTDIKAGDEIFVMYGPRYWTSTMD